MLVSPAGSGKSVIIAAIAKSAVDKGGHVMFMVHRKELVEQITETFRTAEIDLSHTTIMTVGRIKNRLDKLPKPTLIITDETHHSLAKTYRDIYEYYPDVARLGFTATPWRMNGKGFDEVYDDMVEGPTVRWLIDNHYLAPFKYQSVTTIDKQALKRNSTGDYTNDSINEALGSAIFGNMVESYKEFANDKKTIVYAHSLEYSQMFADKFNEAGIVAKHVDSKTPTSERDAAMQDFKDGKIKVLCNVDLISEGFNVPDCSCVIMARPTKSLVLFIQQSMRCMRYQPRKVATILDMAGNWLEHSLPDSPHEWSLKGWKKQQEADYSPPMQDCPKCFCISEKEEWEEVEWDKIPNNLKEDFNENAVHRKCPFCEFILEFESQSGDNKKDLLENIKLQEIDSAFANKVAWSNKHPKKQKSLINIYKVLEAKKELEIGNTKWPLQRAMHIRMDQLDDEIPNDELDILSRYLHKNIWYSYQNTLKNHHFKSDDSLTIIY